MNPKPSSKTGRRVSASEFAKAIGRSREHVTRLASDGTLPPLKDGKLDLVAALLRWCAYLESRLAVKTGADERIKNARAEKLEIGNAAMKRDLIPAEEVQRDCHRVFGELKSQLLRIPRQIEMPCGQEFAERVEREILVCLETVSNANRAKALLADGKANSENQIVKTGS